MIGSPGRHSGVVGRSRKSPAKLCGATRSPCKPPRITTVGFPTPIGAVAPLELSSRDACGAPCTIPIQMTDVAIVSPAFLPTGICCIPPPPFLCLPAQRRHRDEHRTYAFDGPVSLRIFFPHSKLWHASRALRLHLVNGDAPSRFGLRIATATRMESRGGPKAHRGSQRSLPRPCRDSSNRLLSR